MTSLSVVGSVLSGVAQQALGEGVGGIAFSSILALNPELAFSPAVPGSAFVERTGAAATTPCSVGDPIGSLKNWGTKGGFVTATADARRGIMRASGAKRYIESDGIDDDLQNASMAALRAVPGWTMILGLRNDSAVGSAQPLVVFGNGNSRATMFISGGVYSTLGRRSNADASAQAVGLAHTGQDMVMTSIGDFTNTDAFIRGNGVQEGQNLSWLTPGVTDNDRGDVTLLCLSTGANPFPGRLYSALLFPTVLSGAQLALAERWTAEQVDINL